MINKVYPRTQLYYLSRSDNFQLVSLRWRSLMLSLERPTELKYLQVETSLIQTNARQRRWGAQSFVVVLFFIYLFIFTFVSIRCYKTRQGKSVLWLRKYVRMNIERERQDLCMGGQKYRHTRQTTKEVSRIYEWMNRKTEIQNQSINEQSEQQMYLSLVTSGQKSINICINFGKERTRKESWKDNFNNNN